MGLEIAIASTLRLVAKSPCVKGAGILLFSETSKGVSVLLARDTWQGPTSAWSGFEGHSKRGETDKETAAREFVEETMGVVHGMETVPKVLALLVKRKYVCRVCLDVEDADGRVTPYTTFVIRIKHDPSLIRRFQQKRRMLRYVSTLSCQDTRIERDRQTRELTDHAKNELSALCKSTKSGRQVHQAGSPPKYTMQDALDVTYNADGDVVQCHINLDYMEKDKLQFWDLNQLIDLLQNGGRRNAHCIKPYFIASLYAGLLFIKSSLGLAPLPCGRVCLSGKNKVEPCKDDDGGPAQA